MTGSESVKSEVPRVEGRVWNIGCETISWMRLWSLVVDEDAILRGEAGSMIWVG